MATATNPEVRADVDTPFGPYWLIMHSGTGAALHGWARDQERFLTINGIEIKGTIYFELGEYRTYDRAKDEATPAYGWHMDRTHTPYLTRREYGSGEVTNNQRTKVYDVLGPWGAKYLTDHPDLVARGARWALVEARNKAIHEVEAQGKKLAEATDALLAAENALQAFDTEAGNDD